MLSRLKSSLEKRAPTVLGALRNLRGAADPVARPPPVVAPAKAEAVRVQPAPAKAEAMTVQAAPAKAEVMTVQAAPAKAETAPAQEATATVSGPSVEAAPKSEPTTTTVSPTIKPAPAAAVQEARPAPTVAAPKDVAPKTAVKHDKAPEKTKHQAADTGSTDIGAYIARAKANGRDPRLIVGTEGINVAEDGEKFAGPLDNESSRAKAADKLLAIDQFECISCGTCVEQTEKVFYLPADGKATPIAQHGPMDLIQDAIEACPVTCIHWVTPDEAVERNLTSGVGA